jgi:predicted ATPase
MSSGPFQVAEPLSPLLGRAEALERLEVLLRERRLITVIGAPGVGKTRLARALAARRARGGDGGRVSFCSLLDAGSRAQLCARLAAALDMVPAADDHTAESIGRQLDGLKVELLVLDDAEQLAEVVAELVVAWLHAAPDLCCLVTSRERLRVAGETTYELDPLAEPDAQQLFAERLRDARDGVRIEPDDQATVSEIVRRLEGVPLALELAAEQLIAISPRALLERLARPLELLDVGLRGGSARHGSLRAALDGSWQLLTEAERAALAQCAAFRGDIGLPAAEAVIALGEQMPSLPVVLRQLRDRSLLARRDDSVRLPAAIHAYARERLEQRSDCADVYARHAGHYLARGSREHARAHARAHTTAHELASERENLHVVVERGLASGASTAVTSTVSAGLHAQRGVTRAQALAALCLLAEDGRDGAALLALFDRTLDGCAQAGDGELDAVLRARLARGRLRLRVDRAAAALEDFDAVLASARGPSLRAAASCAAGNAQRQLGRHTLAERAYEQALAHHVQQGDRDSEAALLASLGGMFFEQREIPRARDLHERALALYRELGNERGAAVVLQNTGLILQEQGQLHEAELVFREAHRLQIALGNRRFEGIALFDLAGLCFERGLWSKALEWAEQALELLRAQGDRRQAALCLALRGACTAALGGPDGARVDLDRAERELDAQGDRVYGRAVSVHRGHLELALALRAYGSGADAEHAALLARARARIAPRFSGKGAGKSGKAAGERTRPRTQTRSAGPADSDEHRLAVRVLRAELARHRELEGSLLVASDQSWLRGPNARRSPLSSKKVLRRILAALVERRLHAASTPLSAAELVQRGWPNERLAAGAAGNRLQVALAELRKRGLARVLARDAGGYLLDPRVALFVIAQHANSASVSTQHASSASAQRASKGKPG